MTAASTFYTTTAASSEKTDWQTPEKVLDLVRQVAPIALDPCTSSDNPVGAAAFCVHPKDWTPGGPARADGLAQDWLTISGGGLTFVNPPYGRDIVGWVLHCAALGNLGGECVALLPSRTDTSWWHRFIAPPASQVVCFWAGRLTFKGAPSAAPFPSAVVYWGPRPHRFADAFASAGAIWT